MDQIPHVSVRVQLILNCKTSSQTQLMLRLQVGKFSNLPKQNQVNNHRVGDQDSAKSQSLD